MLSNRKIINSDITISGYVTFIGIRRIFMNKIFRNIKENENLDTLEESDDEEEFENISEDKYVDLEMQKIFKCVYSKYHKSWKPLQNINILNDQICRSEEIYNIEKYNPR